MVTLQEENWEAVVPTKMQKVKEHQFAKTKHKQNQK